MADATNAGATSQSSQGVQGQQQANDAQGASAGASSQTQQSGSSSQTTAPTRPDYVPEAFWDAATGLKHKEFGEHYSALATRLAADEVRRNALPKTVDAVKLDLPKEFKIPEGLQWQWKTDAPEYAKLRDIVVKRGLDQDTVTDLVGVYAETQVGSEAQFKAAQTAEMNKLGANATARVTALDTFFTGVLGAEDAKHIRTGMYSAGIVTSLEKLVSKFASQGAASFSQAGRDATPQGRRSAAEIDAMSPAERWAYSKSFDQRQFHQKAS